MKVQVIPEALKPALALAGRAVPSRSTLPILSSVLIRTEGGRLVATATNLDQTVIAECGALIIEEGAITMPYQVLHEWLGTVPSAVIEIDCPEGSKTATLSVARSKTTMSVMDPADYPLVPDVADASEWAAIEIPRDAFVRAAERAVESCAGDDTRPVLCGVHVSNQDGVLTFAGADGFRLSVASLPGLSLPPGTEPVIVHRDAWPMAVEAARRGDVPVRMLVHQSGKRAAFVTKDVTVITQCIQGVFPNYGQLIPKETLTRVTVDIADFGRAVRQARVMSKRGTNKDIIRIVIPRPRDGEMAVMQVAALAEEIGKADCEIDADIEGDGQRIAFNSDYLDPLPKLMDGKAVLALNSPSAQGTWRQAGDDTFTYVLMPMFVSWEGK
jgi:DNA polymerase-3 subunit beta